MSKGKRVGKTARVKALEKQERARAEAREKAALMREAARAAKPAKPSKPRAVDRPVEEPGTERTTRGGQVRVGPQEGPQTQFIECDADIAFFGGAAGGGKSVSLLMDAAGLAMQYPGFAGVIFRKTSTQVLAEGGLWDKSEDIYPLIGGKGTRHRMKWEFLDGQSSVSFAHLEHDKDRFDWQGTELAYIGFDELTQFSATQFWYLVSRNRSMCGSSPMVRATLNPDPDSFACKMVEWYIDQKSGYALPELSGVKRWFVRVGDDMFWGDSKEELIKTHGKEIGENARTFTFIPSMLSDNPIFLASNPGYRSTLLSLPTVDRERLLHGNWKVRPSAGSYFKADRIPVVMDLPDLARVVRYWDRAATEKNSGNDPDWTVGVKMGMDYQGNFYVLDLVRERLNPQDVQNLIRATATKDGTEVDVVLEKDPGQAGVAEADWLVRFLAGFPVSVVNKTQQTEVIVKPFSTQALAGNVRLLFGLWNDTFLSEHVNFPLGKWDDQVVAALGAFNQLALGPVPLTDENHIISAPSFGLPRHVFKPRRWG